MRFCFSSGPESRQLRNPQREDRSAYGISVSFLVLGIGSREPRSRQKVYGLLFCDVWRDRTLQHRTLQNLTIKGFS